MTYILDPALKQWATPRQAEILDAINHHGGFRKAARAMGVSASVPPEAIAAVRKKAALSGFSPEHGMTRTVPEPFVVKGQSTLDRVDPETGERTQVLQWTKTRLSDEAYLQSMKQAVASFCSDVAPIKAPPPPSRRDNDIIPWVQIGDGHLGMLSHAAETGVNFDLRIAQDELLATMFTLIDDLPPTERLVINDLGDMTHYENFSAVTEASGHALDADGRFPKMISIYSATMRAIVDKALTKAKHVDVIVNQGNHSRTNDIWMAELLRVAYGKTGRVHVLNNHSVFIGYRMGNTFVMTHHSDKCKPDKLAGVMMTDFRKDYGETEFHYIDVGHVHHSSRQIAKEHPGVIVESWNNLAPLDKWAHDGGWRNRRCLSTVLRSRTYGEVGRRILPIQEVWDRCGLQAAEPKLAFVA